MTEFSMMTWNGFGAAQGVVSFLRWKGIAEAHRYEHPKLHEIALGVDVLCIQELWLSESERFFESLAHPHKLRDDNRTRWRPLSFGGSGLGVASRLPFEAKSLRAFTPKHVGAERFARKGMLHVRVRVGDVPIDIVSAHLQSGEGANARAVRRSQMTELRAFVAAVADPRAAVIVCGDMNVDGSSLGGRDEYGELSRTLGGWVDLGAEHDWITFHPHPKINALAHRHYPTEPPQRLDYIFFRPGEAPLELIELTRELDQPLPGGVPTYASDHFALRARWRIK